MMALRTAAREAGLLATLRAVAASCRAFSTATAEAPVAAQAAAEADPGLPTTSESSAAVLQVNVSVTANAAKAGKAAKAEARRKQPRRRTPPAGAQQPVAQQPMSFATSPTQGPLSGAALLAAIGEATSIRQLTGLLLANRAEVASEHMMRAISRMGRLQRLAAANPPSTSDQEAFAGTLEVALDMMASEGRSLSPLACCRVMEAAAWLELPPSPQQQAVLEAALAAALHRVQWGRGDAHNWELLLTSYVRLGLQPGPALAAMFAPPLCKAAAADSSKPLEDVPQQQQEQPPPQQQQQEEEEEEADGGQQLGGAFRPLTAAVLTSELGLSSTVHRILRLVLLHLNRMQQLHYTVALNALALRRQEGPRDMPRASRRAAFAAIRARMLAQMKILGAAPCRQLLSASARMRAPLSGEELAIVEAAAVRGLREETPTHDVFQLVGTYALLGLTPGTALAEALIAETEQRLPDMKDAGALASLLLAWHQLGWEETAEVAAAAQAAAVAILHKGPSGGGQQRMASVQHLLGCFTTMGWPLSGELQAVLREAVLQCLPGASAAWASNALSCCRKLSMLPDDRLQQAFLHVSLAVLPGADTETALALFARLLMPLKHQGWQYSSAAPDLQATMRTLVYQLYRPFASLQALQHTPREVRGMLGSVSNCLQLLAACGLRPDDETLQAACAFLKKRQRKLSQKQRDELQSAFQAWGYTQHGLTDLAATNAGVAADDGNLTEQLESYRLEAEEEEAVQM